MSLVKTPSSNRRPKKNRRVLSGGEPASRKSRTFMDRALEKSNLSGGERSGMRNGERNAGHSGFWSGITGRSAKTNGAKQAGWKGSMNGSAHGAYQERSAAPNIRVNGEKSPRMTTMLKPWKLILGSLILGFSGFMYISHQYSTQQTLSEVRELERVYRQSMLQVQELQMELDRRTGPKEVYQKAREQGFVNAGPDDRVIVMEVD